VPDPERIDDADTDADSGEPQAMGGLMRRARVAVVPDKTRGMPAPAPFTELARPPGAAAPDEPPLVAAADASTTLTRLEAPAAVPDSRRGPAEPGCVPPERLAECSAARSLTASMELPLPVVPSESDADPDAGAVSAATAAAKRLPRDGGLFSSPSVDATGLPGRIVGDGRLGGESVL